MPRLASGQVLTPLGQRSFGPGPARAHGQRGFIRCRPLRVLPRHLPTPADAAEALIRLGRSPQRLEPLPPPSPDHYEIRALGGRPTGPAGGSLHGARGARSASLRFTLPPAIARLNPLDFVHHRTDDGRAFPILNILDEYTRECLLIRVSK